MTREEAIHILDSLKPTNTKSSFDAYVVGKAITMAIKALENPKQNVIAVVPSGDAISRQAVIDAIKHAQFNFCISSTINFADYKKEVQEIVDNILSAQIKVINDLPSVNPQEPKAGHWIGIDEEPHEDYECDRCGYTIWAYTANIEPHTEYKYCPNCGCRMVEPQESEEV